MSSMVAKRMLKSWRWHVEMLRFRVSLLGISVILSSISSCSSTFDCETNSRLGSSMARDIRKLEVIEEMKRRNTLYKNPSKYVVLKSEEFFSKKPMFNELTNGLPVTKQSKEKKVEEEVKEKVVEKDPEDITLKDIFHKLNEEPDGEGEEVPKNQKKEKDEGSSEKGTKRTRDDGGREEPDAGVDSGEGGDPNESKDSGESEEPGERGGERGGQDGIDAAGGTDGSGSGGDDGCEDGRRKRGKLNDGGPRSETSGGDGGKTKEEAQAPQDEEGGAGRGGETDPKEEAQA